MSSYPLTVSNETASFNAQRGGWINLLLNDPAGLMVTSLGLTGTQGSVTLNPGATNGAYYNAGSAFAYLSAGETATDSFTYTVSDGHGGSSTATATILITGVNQAPVVRAPTPHAPPTPPHPPVRPSSLRILSLRMLPLAGGPQRSGEGGSRHSAEMRKRTPVSLQSPGHPRPPAGTGTPPLAEGEGPGVRSSRPPRPTPETLTAKNAKTNSPPTPPLLSRARDNTEDRRQLMV